MSAARPAVGGLTIRVAAALSAVTAAIAIAVHLLGAEQARRTLGFGFGGVAHTPNTTLGIFANNARVLTAVLAAGIAVDMSHELSGSALARAFGQALRSICDCALLLFCGLNVLVIGAAYGAYGLRTVRATAAHGPWELAAFSIGLTLYMTARRGSLDRLRFAAGGGAAFALLMIGAIIETYI